MKLKREVLRLAIPSILANITVPLVGMADIAVAGHIGTAGAWSAAALIGGISIGTMLFDLLYWNFAFLRSGTGGLTAQAYGRKEPTGTILLRALRIALLSGAGLILLQWLVVWAAFLVVECSPEVRILATRYFQIRIFAAPATLSLFAFKGWFIGMQDSVRSMSADLIVNGLNILLSIALGLGIGPIPAMGISGIALGTVLSQWAGFAYCTIAILRRYRKEFHHEAEPQMQRESFFTLNRDLFLRSLGMIAVYIGFTVISARYGDMMLAVSTILMKLLMIFSYFTDGFAYAGEALTGRFIGENNRDGIKSTIRDCFTLSGGVALFFILLYGLLSTPLFGLMTSDIEVVNQGKQFVPWLLLMPIIGCPAFIWDGIFTGATASRELRNSTLYCAIGFYLTWILGAYLLDPRATNEKAIHLLMLAYFVHLAVRSIYLGALAPKVLPTKDRKCER